MPTTKAAAVKLATGIWSRLYGHLVARVDNLMTLLPLFGKENNTFQLGPPLLILYLLTSSRKRFSVDLCTHRISRDTGSNLSS